MENSANDTYKTITGLSTAQFKDRGSRFIGFLFPVSSEEDVKRELAALKKRHHDATHHCYAYTVGHIDAGSCRLNDDGEPSGSAARPIYGQLQSAELRDVLAVVVRYFGGVKLGVPGLINAYKTTTRLCVEQAETVEKRVMEIASARFPYDRMNTLLTLLKKEQADIRRMDYDGTQSVIEFGIRRSRYEALCRNIALLPFASLIHQGTE